VDKPDIVKKLMEEEKLGKLESHGIKEGLEVPEELPEESFEDVPDETVGSVDKVIEVVRDITERKKTEEELKETKNHFQTLFNSMVDPVVILDSKGKFLEVTDKVKEITGFEKDDLIGKNFLKIKLLTRKSKAISIKNLLKRMSGIKIAPYEVEVLTKDGRKLPFEINAERIDYKGKPADIVVFRDISDRKQMEHELKDSEERFRLLFENAPDGYFLHDLKGIVIDGNSTAEKLTGYKREELIGKSFTELKILSKGQLSKVVGGLAKSAFGKPTGPDEFTLNRKDGGQVSVEINTCPIRIKGKTMVLGIARDITERKQAEEELRESEERFRSLYESMNEGVCLHNMVYNDSGDASDYRVIDANPKYEKISNLNKKDVVNKLASEIYGTGEPPYLDIYAKVAETGEPTQFETYFPPMDKHFSISAFSPGKGKFATVFEDITKHKKTEEELQKLASVVKHSGELVNLTNIDGKMIFLNEAGEKMLGINPNEIHKHVILDVIPGKLQPKVKTEVLPTILKKGSWEGELQYKNIKTGKITDVHAQIFLIKDRLSNKPLFFANTSLDITKQKKLEAATLESKEQFETLFRNFADLVVIVSSKGKLLDVNDKVLELGGFKKEELVGKNLFRTKIITKKSKVITAKNLLKRMMGQEVNLYEVEGIAKDGEKIPFEVNGAKIQYLGKPADMVILRDVTDRKKAEEKMVQAQKETEAILTGAADGIRIIDKDFKVLNMNKTMADLAGVTMKQGIGMNCQEMFGSKGICGTKECNLVKVLKTGETTHSESVRLKKNGTFISVMDVVSPYRDADGNIIGIIEDFRDIAEIKEAENELKESHELLQIMNNELERKVEDRTADVTRLLKQKDEFVNQLGHDLKNPLGPLLNLLPVLEKDETDLERKKIFDVLNRNTSHIENLVVKTIQLARLNAPSTKLNLEDVGLFSETDDTIKRNRSLFEENNMEIDNRISDKIIIKADKLRLTELFDNLINNAVKYTKGSGTITIDAEQDKDFVTVSVKDTGMGLTEEQLSHIFEEFYKADWSRHDFDSSGLGLPICKRIVEKHGGKIWAESEGEGKGSTFYFTLKTVDSIPESFQKTDESEIGQSDHMKWIEHKDKKILYLDYSNLKGDEYQNASKEIGDYITKLGEDNLLVLANVSGNYFSMGNMKDSRKIGNMIKPYIKKNAIIGITKNQEIFIKSMALFSGLKIKPFDDIDDGKDWLIE